MASPEPPRRALRTAKPINYTQDAGGRTPAWLRKTTGGGDEAPSVKAPKPKVSKAKAAAVPMRALDDAEPTTDKENADASGGASRGAGGWSYETPGLSGGPDAGAAAAPKAGPKLASKLAAKAARQAGKTAPSAVTAASGKAAAPGRKAQSKRPAPAAEEDDDASDDEDDVPVRAAGGAKRVKTAAAKHAGTVIPWPPTRTADAAPAPAAVVPPVRAAPAAPRVAVPPPPSRAAAAVSPEPQALVEERRVSAQRPRHASAAQFVAPAVPAHSDPSVAVDLSVSVAKANAAQAMAANLAATAAAAAVGGGSLSGGPADMHVPVSQRPPFAGPSHSGGAAGSLSEAFSQLQTAYEQLQTQHLRLKASKQSELARLTEEQQRLLDEHGAAAARLVAHWRGEAERSAGAAAEAATAKAQANQLAEQLLAARNEALAARTQMLQAQSEALAAKQQAGQEARLRTAAEDTIAVLRAEAALSDAPGPVTAAGVVAALGANAFATPAFTQLTGLAWSRPAGVDSGAHQFTHVATGFTFRLQRRGLEPDEEDDDDEDDVAEFNMTYVPVAGASLLPEDDMLADRFNFSQAAMPELLGKALVALGTAARQAAAARRG